MVISLSACSGSDDDESGGSGLAGWYMNGLYTTEDVNGAMSSLDLNNTTFFNSSGELCITENTPQTGNVHYATMSYMVTWLRFIEITNSNTLTIYSSGKIFKKGSGYGTKVYELEGNKYTGPLEVYALDGFDVSYKRDGNNLILSSQGETVTLYYSNNSFIMDGITYNKISTSKH